MITQISTLVLLLSLLGNRRLGRIQIPVVEVSSPGAEICREAQPAQIRKLQQAGRLIDGAPEVRDVAVDADEADNVNRGLDGSLGAEEERHPDEVEGKLDGVEGHGVFGGADGVWG